MAKISMAKAKALRNLQNRETKTRLGNSMWLDKPSVARHPTIDALAREGLIDVNETNPLKMRINDAGKRELRAFDRTETIKAGNKPNDTESA